MGMTACFGTLTMYDKVKTALQLVEKIMQNSRKRAKRNLAHTNKMPSNVYGLLQKKTTTTDCIIEYNNNRSFYTTRFLLGISLYFFLTRKKAPVTIPETVFKTSQNTDKITNNQ